MIHYVPASAAHELSEALWRLARPDIAATSSMFPVEVDTNGATWLAVNDEFSIIIHPQAELGEIINIIQPWIDDGHLPADTNARLASLVESLRGQSLVVYDAFPQLFKNMSKTLSEMIAAGLLAEPAMP